MELKIKEQSELHIKEQSGAEAELKMPLWKAHLSFAILFIIFALDIADRSAVGAVFPALKEAFGFSDAQLGFVGSIMGITLVAFVLPVAVLVDRWSRSKMIAIMVAFWSLMTYLTGLARTYPLLLLTRLGVGMGEAGYGTASTSLISAWYPQNKRGTMIGLYQGAWTLGMAGGTMLGGYIALNYGWQYVFGVLAIPGLVLSVIAWFLPDFKAKKVDRESQVEKEVKPKVKETLTYIVKTPTLLYAYLGSAATYLTISSMSNWAPTYFGRAFNLDLQVAAMAVGTISLFTWLGSPFGGWVGDQLTKKGNSRINASIMLALAMGVAFLIALNLKDFNVFRVAYLLAAFLLASICVNLTAATQDLVPPIYRAVSYAFIPMCNQLLAAVWAPVVVGAISDRIGLNSALQIMVVVSAILAATFGYLAAKNHPAAIEKIRKMGTFKLELS